MLGLEPVSTRRLHPAPPQAEARARAPPQAPVTTGDRRRPGRRREDPGDGHRRRRFRTGRRRRAPANVVARRATPEVVDLGMPTQQPLQTVQSTTIQCVAHAPPPHRIGVFVDLLTGGEQQHAPRVGCAQGSARRRVPDPRWQHLGYHSWLGSEGAAEATPDRVRPARYDAVAMLENIEVRDLAAHARAFVGDLRAAFLGGCGRSPPRTTDRPTTDCFRRGPEQRTR